VDVVADMERNGCSRSNSDQSEQGLVRSDTSLQHWSTSSVHRSGSGPVNNKVIRSDPNVFRSRSDQSVANAKQSRSDSGLDRRSVARSPRSISQSERRSSTQSDRAFGVTMPRPRAKTGNNERPRNIVQQKIAGAVEELLPSEKEKLMFAVHKKLHAESIVSFDDPTSSINHC